MWGFTHFVQIPTLILSLTGKTTSHKLEPKACKFPDALALSSFLTKPFRDAIALNIGPDKWQRDQVRSAYKAAEGTNVKIFISFDYSVFDCSTASTTIEYFNEFKSSSSQFYYNGRPMLSSYAGSCLSSSEWRRMKAETGAYLMPFMWGLEGQFNDAWSFLDSWLW